MNDLKPLTAKTANAALPFSYLVFIGRFEPFHNGHKAALLKALTLCRKVIVVMGSAQKPRTTKNPWNVDERRVMLLSCFSEEERERILCSSVCDRLYNDEQWVRTIQHAVSEAIKTDGGKEGPNDAPVGIIGYEKDQSSYYLHMFPQWKRVDMPFVDGISATQVRNAWLAPDNLDGNRMLILSSVPPSVAAFLESFRKLPAYEQLVKEQIFLDTYKKSWEKAPYPPVFVTTDAVVVHSGHILLVRRRAEPGKGLWAFPGGFVKPDERLLDSCIRELREETKLKIPAPVLRGSLKNRRVFDHPERSARGRTITHAFLFEFPAGDLPQIKGGDDADKAVWVPLSDFFDMRDRMFEDHFDIGGYFLGQV